MCDWYRTNRVDDVSLDSDGDMLLFDWGTYSWNNDRFSYDFTRQLIVDGDSDDDELWQLSLTLLFDAEPPAQMRDQAGGSCRIGDGPDRRRLRVQSPTMPRIGRPLPIA